jgi:hypothetical protein
VSLDTAYKLWFIEIMVAFVARSVITPSLQ